MSSEAGAEDLLASWPSNGDDGGGSGGVPTLQEVSKTMQNFTWPDYSVFALMLVTSGLVGVYFGFVRKASSVDEYLVGGRNMKAFPVSLSLIASFISGISLLGTPTEVYVHGTSYVCIGFGLVLVGFVMSYVYLPVFHELKLTSTYEYLERRFDKKIRIFGSILFSIDIMTWLPVVIYVPALAFNQVTGVNIHVVTPFVCIVCIFYTCVGGLKAVVWTDFIQAFMMYGSMLLIVIKGTVDVGGLSVVIRRNLESGRLEFPPADWSPLTRHTLWSLVVGGFVYCLHISAINQCMMQRYLALPTVSSGRRALWFFTFGVFALLVTCGYAGMLIYAWFHDCDPLTTKLAGAKDQLLPLMVMNIMGEYPGLPGLFVAGVFSAAISSLSTGLNSMAAVVLEDFVKPFRKTPFTPKLASALMKLTVIVLGAICVGLVFVVEKTGSHVLQLSINLSSITSGSSLGIFSMGVLCPWINAKGALIGGLSGLSFMSWVSLSAQAAIASGRIKFAEKPVTTEGCTYSFPETESLLLFLPSETNFNEGNNELQAEPWPLFRLSYLWYTVTGALVTMSVGIVVSLITSEDVEKLDPKLVAPFIRQYMRTPKNIPQQIQIGIIDTKTETRRVNDHSEAGTTLPT